MENLFEKACISCKKNTTIVDITLGFGKRILYLLPTASSYEIGESDPQRGHTKLRLQVGAEEF